MHDSESIYAAPACPLMPLEVARDLLDLFVGTESSLMYELPLYKDYYNHLIYADTSRACSCNRMEMLVALEQNLSVRRMLTGCRCDHLTRSAYSVDTIGVYPLHIAAAIGNCEAIDFLLENGAILQAETKCRRLTVFDIALINTRVGTAKHLISKGFQYNAGAGRSRFLHSIFMGNLLCAQLCVEAGVDLRARGLWGEAMEKAVTYNHGDIVQWLLDTGVGSVNDPICEQQTALHIVKHKAMAELLLGSGGDPNKVVDGEGTPLFTHILKENLEVAAVLLKASSSHIDFMLSESGHIDRRYAAIHYAAWRGYLPGVKLLCEHGSNHNLVTYDGNTALGLACHADATEVVAYLLSLGCNLNKRDKDGDTALIYASFNGNGSICRMLLSHGADPSITNDTNVTPLWNAVYSRSLDIVKELLHLNVDPEVPSVGNGIHEMAVAIYDKPVVPLFVALHHEEISIAKALIAAGCFVNSERLKCPELQLYIDTWQPDNKRWINRVTSTVPSLMWWSKRVVRRSSQKNLKRLLCTVEMPFIIAEYITKI